MVKASGHFEYIHHPAFAIFSTFIIKQLVPPPPPSPHTHTPCAHTLSLPLFQQVVYYSNIIFSQFGDSRRASYETSSIGATLVVFALLSIWLVNRTGRRFLLLFGLAVMSLSSIVFVLLQELEVCYMNHMLYADLLIVTLVLT